MTSATHRAIEAIWRIDSPKLIARLSRIVRDVGLAEELAQDAFVSALTQWPEEGIPRNPGAWLMASAKRRAIDRWRRDQRLERNRDEIGRSLQTEQVEDPFEAALDEDVGDDLLGLMFVACHPVLATESRVALTLRLLGGPTTPKLHAHFSLRSRRLRNESCARNGR